CLSGALRQLTKGRDQCEDAEQPARADECRQPDVRDGRGVWRARVVNGLPQVAEEARVAHAAGEAPGGREVVVAAPLVARAAPSAVEEESADEVVVEKLRRPLRPRVPAAHGLADDAEEADEEREAAYEFD